MAVIALALALPLFLNVLLQNTRSATAHWNQAFDLSVYLDTKAGIERAKALGEAAARRDGCGRGARDHRRAGAGGVSHRVGLRQGARCPHRQSPAEHPDGHADAGGKHARGHGGASGRASRRLPMCEAVQLDTEWVERLNAMLEVLRRVVWLTGGLLGLGVVAHRRQHHSPGYIEPPSRNRGHEIGGATDGFARRPFLYSGVWYGLGGGLGRVGRGRGIAVAVLARPIEHLAGLYGSDFRPRGLSIRPGARHSGAGRGAWLDRLLACCNATYPRRRAWLSPCFDMMFCDP